MNWDPKTVGVVLTAMAGASIVGVSVVLGAGIAAAKMVEWWEMRKMRRPQGVRT